MSKYVRLENNVVTEIIPESATKPSIEYWYGAEFASRCIEAPDEVEQHWLFDTLIGAFSEPPEMGILPTLDELTLTQLAIAELAEAQTAAQTANELALAELAEMLLGGES